VKKHRKFRKTETDRLLSGIRSVKAAIAATLGVPLPDKGFSATVLHSSPDVSSFIKQLLNKILRVGISQGVEQALTLLKKSSSKSRDLWMKEETLRTLLHIEVPSALRTEDFTAQFSFVGRSLPVGSTRAASSALKKHKENLSSEWKTPLSHIVGIRKFAHNWAKQHIPKGKDRLAVLSMSSSACWTYTRKSGGLARWVRESLDGAPEVMSDRPPGILDQEWADIVAERRLLEFCLSDTLKNESLIRKAKVAVIDETGLKNRIVTKSYGTTIVLGHLARRRLSYGLTHTKGLKSVLKGDHDGSLKLHGSGEVNSSDLTSATDLFPLDLVDSLIEGLIESDRFREEEVLGLQLCTGSMEIHYEDSVIQTKKEES